ncbi:hypothetical protein LZ32DRAFT_371014 [Colletotrichum eremochloae]|nr:hypothetical protein LZ32DRAFT_371014 [Colletotrichum eremochloae]
MATLQRRPAAYDPVRVQDWVAAEEIPEAESLASRLCAECIKTFKLVLREAGSRNDLPQLAKRSLERSGSSLILWAEGHGVADGKLDDALAKSRMLQQTLMGLLVSVSETLADRIVPQLISQGEVVRHTKFLEDLAWEAKMAVRDSCQSSDSEESDSDTSSSSVLNDWDEIADDIRTDVECLIDLEPLIQAPFVDHRKSKAIEKKPEKLETWTPRQLYTSRISHRFPNARLELVNRLAQANWDRFQRIQSDKERNIAERGNATREEKTESRTPTENDSNFHDSGLGTSQGTRSAYAETTMSYRQNTAHSIRIPPLPMEAKKGRPFECLACGRQIRIMNNSAWKKHLFNDLQPWLCHDVSCRYGADPFTSREDWIQHLTLEHGFTNQSQSVNCPLCLEPMGNGKVGITKHLSSHLEEISLSSLPAGVASDGDSDEDSSHGISHSYDNNSVSDGHAATSQSDIMATQSRQPQVEETGAMKKPIDLETQESKPESPPYPERRTISAPSSYWSLSEAAEFPLLLKMFGTDWASIAAHMGTKTAVMVKNYFIRQKDQGKLEWAQFAADADAKRTRSENQKHDTSEPYNSNVDWPEHGYVKEAQFHQRSSNSMATIEDEEPYIIKCICNYPHDDGQTIYCETCDTWQHIECYYPDNLEGATREDFHHSCAECEPRPLDQQRAIERIRRFRSGVTTEHSNLQGPEKSQARHENHVEHKQTTVNAGPPPHPNAVQNVEAPANSSGDGLEEQRPGYRHAAGPLAKFEAIAAKFNADLRQPCEDFIAAPPTNAIKRVEEYRKLSESAMQHVLLKLDEFDTEGDPDARAARKAIIRDVQEVLGRLSARAVS